MAPSGQRTLLWRDDHRRGRIVVAQCGRCRRAGVRLGMSVAQAVDLASPENVERHDPGGDGEMLAEIAQYVARRISPMVAVEPLDDFPWAGHWRHQSESLWIDITGLTHLFQGGESGILRSAHQMCHEMNLHPRMAIADTPAAAWALAHYGDPETVSDLSAIVVPPDHGVAPLLPLPTEALRISESTVATLARLGVATLGELLRLPRSGVASRLGETLIRRIDQITGDRSEPITIHEATAEYVASWELEYPTVDLNILSDRLRRCTESLQAALATKGHGAQCVTCRLDLTDHPPIAFDVGLFAPSRDVDHLHGLLDHHLQSAEPPSDVVRLTLSVVLAAPMRSQQTTLFECHAGAMNRSFRHDLEIARLVDSIATRVGRTRVVQPSLMADPLPEAAVTDIPLCGNMTTQPRSANARSTGRGSTRRSSHRWSTQSHRQTQLHRQTLSHRQNWAPTVTDAMRRPLSLLPRPVPLLIRDDRGRFVPQIAILPSSTVPPSADAPPWTLPKVFRSGGVVYRVVRWWGPERIETDWWKGTPVSRDYFRVETDRGTWWWIFRKRTQTHQIAWYLHGRFA